MAPPSIIAQLITAIYALADVHFVSAPGTAATAAVGVNASLDRCITMVGSLLGNGAGSCIARLLGAKRKADADRVRSAAALTGASIGVIMMTAGLLVRKPLVYFLGATEDCAVYSMQYAQYVLIAAPFMIGTFLLSLTLRNEAAPRVTGGRSIASCRCC